LNIIFSDESTFVYDVKLRAVWAVKGSNPIMLTTGSHRRTCWFGAIAEDGTQLFRQYPNSDSDGFLNYLPQLMKKYPKMILFIDKASYHRKEKRVKRFLRKHKESIKVRWFPSGFPEANPMEECWNQGKDSVLGSTFHDSFLDFKREVAKYYRTKRFKLDLYKYLCH
jgi:transposase